MRGGLSGICTYGQLLSLLYMFWLLVKCNRMDGPFVSYCIVPKYLWTAFRSRDYSEALSVQKPRGKRTPSEGERMKKPQIVSILSTKLELASSVFQPRHIKYRDTDRDRHTDRHAQTTKHRQRRTDKDRHRQKQTHTYRQTQIDTYRQKDKDRQTQTNI